MGYPTAMASGGSEPRIDLRIIATSDLHMHLLPYDYAADRPSHASGFANTAALIRAARRDATNSLTLDNGDFLHGSAMGESIAEGLLGKWRPSGGSHPMVAAFQALGYDAVTLGNHDFDRGVEFLGDALRDAPFGIITSNVSFSSRTDGPDPLPVTQPFAVLDRHVTDKYGTQHHLRIGILGMLPPDSITGLAGGSFTAEIRDIVATAEAIVPELRELGADLVIVLAHSGIGSADYAPGMENAVVPLAAVSGIDAIVAGHAHQVFPATGTWPDCVDPATGHIHGTPVVSPGFWGSHLGLIDLTITTTRAGGWRVASSRVEARPIAPAPAKAPSVTPDRQIVRMLAPLREEIEGAFHEPIGQTRRRLHSYFATAAPSPAIDLVHRAMLWFGSAQQKDHLPDDLPLVASAAPFKVGGLAGPDFYTDIAPGPISVTALTDLYHYPNTLRAVHLTGAELSEWLERAASVFSTIVPGSGDQPLFLDHCPGYGFETLAGCTYEIDLKAAPRYGPFGKKVDPGASRIRDLRIAGVPVHRSDGVVLLTNSFRISGGGRYPLPRERCRFSDLSVGVRDVIADYLVAVGPYDDPPAANWRFAPVHRAQALVFSSPRALEVVGDATGRGFIPGEKTPSGFQTFHLAL